MNIIRLLLVIVAGGQAYQSFASCSFVPGALKANWEYTMDLSRLGPSATSYIIDQTTISDAELASLSGVTNRFSTIATCDSPGDIILIGFSGMDIAPLTNNSTYFLKPVPSADIGFFIRSNNGWVYPSDTGTNTIMTLSELYAMRGNTFDSREGKLSWNDINYGNTTTSAISLYTYKGGVVTTGGTSPGSNILNINAGGLDLLTATIAPLTVKSFACSTNYEPTIELGTKYIQQLPYAGSTSDATPFYITLTCGSPSLRPMIRFDGNGVGEDLDKKFFSNNGTAENIGLQLLYQNALIIPGAPVSLGGAINLYVKSYQFDARLYKINNDRDLGSVEISVNLTLDYE